MILLSHPKRANHTYSPPVKPVGNTVRPPIGAGGGAVRPHPCLNQLSANQGLRKAKKTLDSSDKSENLGFYSATAIIYELVATSCHSPLKSFPKSWLVMSYSDQVQTIYFWTICENSVIHLPRKVPYKNGKAPFHDDELWLITFYQCRQSLQIDSFSILSATKAPPQIPNAAQVIVSLVKGIKSIN